MAKSASATSRRPENIIHPRTESETIVKFQVTLPEPIYDRLTEQGRFKRPREREYAQSRQKSLDLSQ